MPKILNFVRIIHYYSKLFTGVLTRGTDAPRRPGDGATAAGRSPPRPGGAAPNRADVGGSAAEGRAGCTGWKKRGTASASPNITFNICEPGRSLYLENKGIADWVLSVASTSIFVHSS